MTTVYMDTESFLIAPGTQAPPIVCVQACVDDGDPLIVHVREPRCKRLVAEWLTSATIIGHNVAFDMCAIMAQWPDLVRLVFASYEAGRVSCTETRAKLLDIAAGADRGAKKPQYDLGECSRRAGGPVLDKSDPWRLKYGTLYDVDVEKWPSEAVAYAKNDATATRAVYLAQSRAKGADEALVDEYRQARAALALALVRCRGMATDRVAVDAYIEKVKRTLIEDTLLCQQKKLVRYDGTKDVGAARAYLAALCTENEETPPETETGEVSLSEEAIEEHGDYVLEAYQRYANAKTREKRAKRLRNSPIQARFNSLINTGRVSCSQGDSKKKTAFPSAFGAQIQNPSKEKGFRECFVARPGYALVSIDYDALELRTFGQVCIWLTGGSKLAAVLNAGRDPHTELGALIAGITAEEAYALRQAKDAAFDAGPRFLSKAANFGFPGGMGAKKFLVSLVKQSVHNGDPAAVARAKAMTDFDAKELRKQWMRQWPEVPRYFLRINDLLDGRETCTVKHFVSHRLRGQCWYTQACNSFFQGLASDLAKAAMWRVVRECYADTSSPLYRSFVVNFIHDELLLEVPLDKLHDASFRARDIMCATGNEFCPDLTFTAEPAAMGRWSKSAKSVYDASGRLTIDPKTT